MRKLFDANKNIEKHYSIFAGKWRRYHGLSTLGHLSDIKTILKNIRDAFLFAIGLLQSLFILIIWRPDIVFVKGGFVGLPVGLAAAVLRIPIVTHDSDSVPGLTNRILSRFAKRLCVALPVNYYAQYYPKAKMRYCGIPIRNEFYTIGKKDILKYKDEFKLSKDIKIISIIGGSLGAIRLNEAVLAGIDNLLKKGIYVFWITGKRQHETIKKRLSQNGEYQTMFKLFAFADDLYKVLAVSDLVVSRAGATSIAELAMLSKAVILVPNPYLVGGHQTKNAMSLLRDEAADVITEQQLHDHPESLNQHIYKLLNNSSDSDKLANNLHKLAVKDASKRIAGVIQETLKNEVI